MSKKVLLRINLPIVIDFIAHAPTIRVVRAYTNIILLNSKSSELKGVKINGVTRNKAKNENVITFWERLLIFSSTE